MTEHRCDGCGSTNDQFLIGEHPSGRWYHVDMCMPPDEWRPPDQSEPLFTPTKHEIRGNDE